MRCIAKLGSVVFGVAALAAMGCGSGGGSSDAAKDLGRDQGKDQVGDAGKDASGGSGGTGQGGSGGASDVAVDTAGDLPGDSTPEAAIDLGGDSRDTASDLTAETAADASDTAPEAANDLAAAETTDGALDSSDASTDGASPDTVVVAPTAKRLLTGRARLVGTPTNACSQIPKGSAIDQWCAFTLPGQSLGATELWVLNATKAITTSIVCNSTDVNCLRVSAALWTGQPDSGPTHPFSHRFYGQTLVFYAAPVAGTDSYDGPVFAWRPGQAQARQISGAHAFSCDGHPRSDSAICIEDLSTTNPFHFDIHAGRVTSPPLPLASAIYPSTATNATQWSLAFSPAGDYVAYSTGGPLPADVETLYVSKTDEVGMAGKRITAATGVSQWDITPDSKHWFFMRNFNYPPRGSVIDPAGTLVMADFPAGGGEKTIATQVGSYLLLGDDASDRGVAFLDNLTNGKGTFKIISNPALSTTAVTVASGVLSAELSPDGRYSFLQTQFSDVTLTGDARVVKNDGTGNCALAAGTAADIYGAPFLDNGGMVFWADNINAVTGAAEGWRASPDGCNAKQKFADDLDFWFVVGSQGLIYSDAVTTTATIRYVKLGAGGQWPAGGPTTIRTGANRVYGLLEPDRQYVVYSVDSGGVDDGLWLYGPIGFGNP